MTDSFRTLIVTAADAPLARSIAETLSPIGGSGMWTTPLGSDSSGPATHYISTGWINSQFAYMVPCQWWAQDQDGAWVKTSEDAGNAQAVYGASVAGGLTITQADVDRLFATSDVTAQEPFVAMVRLGLVMVQPPEPDTLDE